MYNLVVAFEDTDIDLKQTLEEKFGNSMRYNTVKNFDGLSIFLTTIIPISTLSIQLFDFILTHFARKEQPSKNLHSTQRLIIDKEGSIDLTNYSEEEAIQILKAYFENQKNNE